MAAVFLPNRNVNAAIAAEATGNVFDAGTEPWLGQSGALDCLQIFILSPSQSNIWITGQVFEEMISLKEIILY